MSGVDLTSLPEFLRSRRWYAGKGLPVKHVQLLDGVHIGEEPGFDLAVVEVIYEVGHPHRYLVSLRSDEAGRPTEALEHDEVAWALLGLVRGSAEVSSLSGVVRGESLGDDPRLSTLPALPPVRRLSAEQSNTSLVYGDRAILKVLRRLDFGNNPEWEMGQFLRRKGFRFAPQLLGGLVLDGTIRSTLAVVHEYLPAETDGWAWMLGLLGQGTSGEAELAAEVRQLGLRLAEFHLTMASEPDDPAFAPEPVLREDVQRWASSIIGEAGVTLNAAAEQVKGLVGRREDLVARIDRLARVEPSGSKLRIHGDFHLGQTLRSGGEWFLFDFEGEPTRSYAARREKHTPLRDVAGMLRSFAYAVGAIEQQGGPADGRLPVLRQEFLAAYRKRLAGTTLLPDEGVFPVVLEVLELEKLLYELRYEVLHRPDWVRIPARALLATLE